MEVRFITGYSFLRPISTVAGAATGMNASSTFASLSVNLEVGDIDHQLRVVTDGTGAYRRHT